MGAVPVEEFQIVRAKRSESRLRLAVTAESGGGKTWSSLELAFGLVEEYLARGLIKGGLIGKIGVIDTERKSAGLYSHLGPFDTLQLGPPYSTDRYAKAFRAMELSGAFVIIVDGISPAWAGVGGLRSVLATFSDKDRFGAYDTTINPAQDEFIDMILRSPCHVICTMRMKTDWVIEDKMTRGGYTVKAPRRIGLKPIQRDGVEYDFTTVFSIDNQTNKATLVKNRCTLFADWVPKKLSREHGRQLATWLLEAEPDSEPVVGGTPQERAEAVGAAVLRGIDQASTMPDLARAFADGERDIKAFRGVVHDDILRPLIEALKASKEARKVALGGDRAQRQIDTSLGDEPPGPTDVAAGVMEEKVTEEQEGQLRRAVTMAGISVADCITQFKVARLGDIRRTAFGQCMGWIQSRAGERPGQSAGAKGPPKNHFEDMEDDIPF